MPQVRCRPDLACTIAAWGQGPTKGAAEQTPGSGCGRQAPRAPGPGHRGEAASPRRSEGPAHAGMVPHTSGETRDGAVRPPARARPPGRTAYGVGVFRIPASPRPVPLLPGPPRPFPLAPLSSLRRRPRHGCRTRKGRRVARAAARTGYSHATIHFSDKRDAGLVHQMAGQPGRRDPRHIGLDPLLKTPERRHTLDDAACALGSAGPRSGSD